MRDWHFYLMIIGIIWLVIYMIVLNREEHKKSKEIKKHIKQ